MFQSLRALFSYTKWLLVIRSLTFLERIVVFCVLSAIVIASVVWVQAIYNTFTKILPQYGGTYKEAMVRQPRHINPLLAQSQTDLDLTRLIYSSLLRYDENGRLTNDIAENYFRSEDDKTYTVTIKKGIEWHNGKPLTVDDIIFTIARAQDPRYQSIIRDDFDGLTTTKIDDYTVQFTLKEPYAFFPHVLTFGILPKHQWEGVQPEQFSLTEKNLAPIGSGPYKFEKKEKKEDGVITSITLTAFEKYHQKKPYISTIIAYFYSTHQEAIGAYKKHLVNGVQKVFATDRAETKRWSSQEYHFVMPHYYAVFFNQRKNVSLGFAEVRTALALATNRDEIISGALKDAGFGIYGPFFDAVSGYNAKNLQPSYDLQKAKKILEERGWTIGEDGIRTKGKDRLAFTITVPNWPEANVADFLKKQWGEIGAEVTVQNATIESINNDIIPQRSYDALLWGHAINYDPYLLRYWHSSEADEGANFARLKNEKVDEILDEIRKTYDEKKRAEFYDEFQKIIVQENPAIFLYNPWYNVIIDKNIKGVVAHYINAAEDRFWGIENWYIKTKRVWEK